MNDITALRIHVAPVGFEVDRIVIPVEERKADRVWLMAHSGDDKAGRYAEEIHRRLGGAGMEIMEKPHDRTDLFDIIRATREIIQQEAANNVFVNLSSGSKIQAVGCVMACMMFNESGNVHPYYAEPLEYHQQDRPLSTGVRRIIEMPRYEVPVPSGILVRALHLIRRQARIKKKDLLEVLEQEGIIVVAGDRGGPEEGSSSERIMVNAQQENRTIAGLARMEQNIIRPLVEWKFVRIEKIGRNRWVSLTEEGRNAAKFLPAERP